MAFKLTLALLVALAASNELESLDNSNNQAMSSVGMFGGATASGTVNSPSAHLRDCNCWHHRARAPLMLASASWAT